MTNHKKSKKHKETVAYIEKQVERELELEELVNQEDIDCQSGFDSLSAVSPHAGDQVPKTTHETKKNDYSDELHVVQETMASLNLSNPPKNKARRDKDKKRTSQTKLTCSVCYDKFETRNMLFAHIREKGHARAVPIKK